MTGRLNVGRKSGKLPLVRLVTCGLRNWEGREGLDQHPACAHIVRGSCRGVVMRESAAIRQDTPKLVSDLLDGLQEPRTPYISPTRFGELAGVSQGTIARLAGVHRNTVRVNPASEPLQDRLREMIKIITSAVELTGDVEKAFFWFRNEPIADYKRKTAATLVAEGHAGRGPDPLKISGTGRLGNRQQACIVSCLLSLSPSEMVLPTAERSRCGRRTEGGSIGRESRRLYLSDSPPRARGLEHAPPRRLSRNTDRILPSFRRVPSWPIRFRSTSCRLFRRLRRCACRPLSPPGAVTGSTLLGSSEGCPRPGG